MSKTITYYNSGAIPLANAGELPYDVVNLAFLSSASNNPFKLILSGAIAATETSFTAHTVESIQTMQQNGQRVLISFGGGDMDHNVYYSLSQDPDRLADSWRTLLKITIWTALISIMKIVLHLSRMQVMTAYSFSYH